MKNISDDFLSINEVRQILSDAWALSSSPNKDMPTKQLKVSDWNVLEEDIKMLFESGEYGKYKISTYSGEAYYKLVGISLSKKARAIYTLVLFILIKRGQLTVVDKDLLHNFQNIRNHFLQIYLSGNSEKTKDESPQLKIDSQVEDISTKKKNKKSRSILVWFLVPVFLLLSAFPMYYYLKPPSVNKEIIIIDDQNIKLKVLPNKNGFYPPCDVTFEYDLTSNQYKEASLNILDQIIPITKPKGQHIFTFTDPLVTEVFIKADNKVKKLMIPINSVGWIALLDQYIAPLSIKNGILYHDINTIPAPVLADGIYYVTYMTINNFGIDGDNMVFETRVKNPKSEGGISCFDIAIDVNGSTTFGKGILSFNLLSKGCERYAKIRVGDLSLPNPDFLSLIKSGIDASNWMIIKASTKNGVLTISVDDEILYELKYNGSIGDVKVMQLGFKGSGSVDWVSVKTHDGKELYREDFDKVNE